MAHVYYDNILSPSNSSFGISIPPPADSSPDYYSRGRSRSRSPNRGSAGVNQGNNLHVSGLSKRLESRDLEDVFGRIGRVSKAQIMYDPHTHESRGFAFVTMDSPEEAEAAIVALHNTELDGMQINVKKARRGRARTPTPGKYFGPPKQSTSTRGSAEGRPYSPRPYDPRYNDDRGGRSQRGRYNDDYDYDRRRDYDDYDPRGRRGGGGRDDYRGGGRRY
ncbi:hypothetical protein C8F01DRAFT_215216 [Mycena amicta]|nr:hypothetical protein C8F01DRAFT_215216 [Mycena amicta]